MITDAQVHLWEPSRPERPWAANAQGHLPEPMTAERMLGLMDEAGIDRAVISPTQVLPERSPVYALEVAAKYPSRFRVMGWFLAKHMDLLPRWLEQPGMCSLRLSLNEESERRQLAEGVFEPLWEAAVQYRIPVAVWRRDSQNELEAVVKRHPELLLIIDHFNWAAPAVRELRLEELERLARYPNVHVKVSSLPKLTKSPPPYQDLAPHIKRVHSAYGAQRLMWGSDQTQVMAINNGSYADNVDIIRKAEYLSAEDREWMLNGTAARVFGWEAAP